MGRLSVDEDRSGEAMGGQPNLVLVPAWAVRDRHAILRWVQSHARPGASVELEPAPILEGCAGAVVLDRSECSVVVDGIHVDMHLPSFLFLEALLVSDGEAQHAEDLARMLWGDVAKARSSTLRAVVHDVRRALGRHAAHIRSVRCVGYQWIPACGSGAGR